MGGVGPGVGLGVPLGRGLGVAPGVGVGVGEGFGVGRGTAYIEVVNPTATSKATNSREFFMGGKILFNRT